MPRCKGCGRSEELDDGVYCTISPQPQTKWRNGKICNMATHIKKSPEISLKKPGKEKPRLPYKVRFKKE